MAWIVLEDSAPQARHHARAGTAHGGLGAEAEAEASEGPAVSARGKAWKRLRESPFEKKNTILLDGDA